MIEALAHAGIPTIPVRVWYDGKWRKQPLEKWDDATTDCETLARWQRQWPDARPGVPLERVGCVAIDVDADDPAFWEIWNGLGPRGPYSKIQTVSGGWHFVFAQCDPPIGKMQWSERNGDVEILGASCLLTVYDVDEILFPRVAPRAVLPEVFRKPYVRPHGYPSIKATPVTHVVPADVTNAASLTEALFALDPCEWRYRHDDWLALAMACKAVGISCREFVRWSVADPVYAADQRRIERKWHSFEGRHGGALYAALAAHGVKVSAKLNAERALIAGVPTSPRAVSRSATKSPSLQSRSNGLIGWLARNATGDGLFSAACLFAELRVTQDATTKLVNANLPSLRKALGAAEFTRQIARAYARIEGKQNEGENQNDPS
jgi:Bifunctional DNA primase/polymerase, N-terminal/Primase C terminal 2 (PriCT-2)